MRPYYFSEFSYGFAVTAEFIRDPACRVIDPPEFPSLRREGQAGGGADVRLNTPGVITYLQFKLSDYMCGPTAAERHLFPSRTYYRFHVRNDGTESGMTQHELLMDLDRRLGNQVYYIAPGFYYEQPWRDSYRGRQVVQNSIMFSPAVLGPVDNNTNHIVAFENAYASFGWLCSEPEKRRGTPGKEAMEQLKSMARDAPPLTIDRLEAEAKKLGHALEVPLPDVPVVPPHLAEEFGWDRATIYAMQAARQLASIARSHLDCTLALITSD
jgi:hypothetical protein